MYVILEKAMSGAKVKGREKYWKRIRDWGGLTLRDTCVRGKYNFLQLLQVTPIKFLHCSWLKVGLEIIMCALGHQGCSCWLTLRERPLCVSCKWLPVVPAKCLKSTWKLHRQYWTSLIPVCLVRMLFLFLPPGTCVFAYHDSHGRVLPLHKSTSI